MRRYLFCSLAVGLLLVAVSESRSAHLYFSEFSGGRIGRANLDGSGQITLVSGISSPIGPTLDLARGHLYWGEPSGADIWRANLDGSGQMILISGRNGPGAPALDLANHRVYWNDSGGGSIHRAYLDGSGRQVLVTGLNDPHAVVLYLEHGKIYWPDFGAGKIWRANLDGTDSAAIVSGQASPVLMALDPAGGKIYWTSHGSGDIRRANLDGSNPEIIVRNQNLPTGIALDPYQSHVYWTTFGGNDIRRANLDGSGIQILLTNLSGPTFVSLDRLSDGPPVILFSPQTQSVVAGAQAMVTAGVAGAKPMDFQWQHNGDPLPEGAAATLILDNVTFQDAGSYRLVASNALGSAESEPAMLNVVPLIITAQTMNTNVWLGSNVTFQVAASSTVPVGCQWYRNDAPIPAATNLTLAFTNVQLDHEADYAAVLTNSFGSVTSRVARLAVLVRPVILQAPLSQSLVVGGSVTLSVEITGNPPPFTYQWRRGSTILTNMVSEKRVAFFTLDHVQTNQGGLHRVLIANAASPTLSGGSPNASWILTVLADADSDGLPDTWETEHELDPQVSNSGQDNDQDGSLDSEEYVAGTDPQNPSKCLRIEGIEIDGRATIQFQALSNKTYTLLYSDHLGSGSWSKLADVVARATNRLERVLDPQASGCRFYQLATPRLD